MKSQALSTAGRANPAPEAVLKWLMSGCRQRHFWHCWVVKIALGRSSPAVSFISVHGKVGKGGINVCYGSLNILEAL